MSKIHTHYDNLQVSRTASAEVISAAYKALCIRFHPDKNPGDKQAEKIMKIINRSYAVLSDPNQRAKHDAWIDSQSANRSDSPEASPKQGNSQAAENDGPKPKSKSTRRLNRARLMVGTGVLLLGALGIIETVVSSPKEEGSPSVASSASDGASDPLAPIFGPEAKTQPNHANDPASSTNDATRAVSRAPDGASWPTAASYVPGYEIGSADGLSTVTVDNSRNSSAMFVKLISAGGGLARAFYVPGNETFSLRRVTAGTYELHYQDLSDGSYWGSQPFKVTEIAETNGTKFSKISVTLFKVLNGNFETHSLRPSDF